MAPHAEGADEAISPFDKYSATPEDRQYQKPSIRLVERTRFGLKDPGVKEEFGSLLGGRAK